MSLGDKDKLNRVEELKGKLFSKSFPTKIEHRDSFSHLRKLDIPDSWEKEKINPTLPKNFFMRSFVFKKFFLFSLGFFILALGYGAFMFFFGSNTVSTANIDISIVGNTFTAGGEELPLIVGITNRNNSSLELVDLLVEFPRSSSGDLSQNTERLRQSIGTISPGGTKNENIKVILFGEQGSIRPVRVAIEYRVEGSNAIFIKEKIYEVTINSTPIDLTIDAPSEISPNQDVTLNLGATLNSTRTAKNMLIRVDYPLGFQFTSANPAPSFGNNVWNLGDLPPGSTSKISIVGKMLDVFDGEEKIFRAWTGSQSLSDKSIIEVVFNSKEHALLISRPFIQARLFVNGVYKSEYTSDSKSIIQGEIQWMNNLETRVNDLQIRAKISGNAVNRNTIKAQQGFYNSAQDVIVWDKNFRSQFAEVNPGESGSVSFSMSPLSLFSGTAGMLSSPSINIEVSITGRQPTEGNAVRELVNSESKIIKIISDVGFATKALYFSGPFDNKGPIPPKAEEKTTYTIVWNFSNTANNISKAQVRSSLPPWASFEGSISPTTEDLTFNASTKEIIWNVGNIPRGTGITGETREASFQVSLLPSLSQVGTRPTLINDAVLTGYDDFANVDIRVTKTPLNTFLSNDPAFPVNGDRVVE